MVALCPGDAAMILPALVIGGGRSRFSVMACGHCLRYAPARWAPASRRFPYRKSDMFP